MKKPHTLEQIENAIKTIRCIRVENVEGLEDQVVSETSSTKCKKCGKRVFFWGDCTQEDMPLNWTCPHCQRYILGRLGS